MALNNATTTEIKTKIDIDELLKNVPAPWLSLLVNGKMGRMLLKIIEDLDASPGELSPSVGDIFNFARYTSLNDIKIVIVGQDPYPKKGDAHGLAFSSLSRSVPASLKNIYSCLINTGEIKMTETKELNKGLSQMVRCIDTSNLTPWAKQGVLLLNTSLTVQVGSPNTHKNIWKNYTDELIRLLSYRPNGNAKMKTQKEDSLIFMLWGNYAISKKKFIDTDFDIVLEWAHPSPLAQSRLSEEKKFINCDHFRRANDLLANELSLPRINWNPVESHELFTDGSCPSNGKGILAIGGYATYFSKGCFTGTMICGSVPTKLVTTVITPKVKHKVYSKKSAHCGNTYEKKQVKQEGEIKEKEEMVYPSNNRAEGLAILYGLEFLLDKKSKAPIVITTDSMFWKEMIETHMPNWNKKGVDFRTKKNPDITTNIWKAINNVKKNIGDITIRHVASHGKDVTLDARSKMLNDLVDKWAVKYAVPTCSFEKNIVRLDTRTFQVIN